MSAVNCRKKLSGLAGNEGQALVEGALILLVFFVFLFAIFEAGRLLQVRQTLTDAARAGARRSVTPLTQTLPGTLPDVNDVRGVVQSFLMASSINVPSGNISVTQNVDIGGTIFSRVTVTYDYHPITLSMFGMLNMTLTGRSLMRNETSP